VPSACVLGKKKTLERSKWTSQQLERSKHAAGGKKLGSLQNKFLRSIWCQLRSCKFGRRTNETNSNLQDSSRTLAQPAKWARRLQGGAQTKLPEKKKKCKERRPRRRTMLWVAHFRSNAGPGRQKRRKALFIRGSSQIQTRTKIKF